MGDNSKKSAAISGKTLKPRGKSFVKGVSGNPTGRPARTAQELDLIAACKDKTAAALDVLLSIMEQGENERNRITAAMAIIERAHGKPLQPTTIGNPDGTAIDMNLNVVMVKTK